MPRQEVRKTKRYNKRTSESASSSSNLRVEASELHYGTRISKPFSSGPARGAASLVIYDHDLPTEINNNHGWYIDTETDGLEARRDKLRLVTLCDRNNNLILVRNPDHLSHNLDWAINFLGNTFHHAAFDLKHLLWWMNIQFDASAITCTKVLAKATGQFEHSGLNWLVKKLLKVDLGKKKEITVSNWNAQILSAEQIEYACCDVLYLKPLKAKLQQRLATMKRINVAMHACATAAMTAYTDLAGYSDTLYYNGIPNETLRKQWEARNRQMTLDIATRSTR